MSDQKFQPCPFCGNDGAEVTFDLSIDEYYVLCSHCRASGPVMKTPEDAVYEWKTRTDNERDELRAELARYKTPCVDSADFPDPDCVCHETSTRNCPVHQNGGRKR